MPSPTDRTAGALAAFACVVVLLSTVGQAAAEPSSPRMALEWPDRRPIGTIFLSNYTKTSETNPGGYLADPAHDLTTEAGRAEFRQALIEEAESQVRSLKKTNAQGMILWDVCGARERGMMYVGDPRMLPKYAPHFDQVVDDYFKQFREAGLRTGVTLRPIHVRKNKPSGRDRWGLWGYEIYNQKEFDIREELSDRMRYAKQRWGCSIFYLDSNLYRKIDEQGDRQRTPLPVEMIAQLRREHPECLIIPEHAYHKHFEQQGKPLGYHPYAAVYRAGGGTPDAIREALPRAFSVLVTRPMASDPTHAIDIWPQRVRAVMAGDIMLTPSRSSAVTSLVRAVHGEADFREKALPSDAAPVKKLNADAPWMRYHALRALGERGDYSAAVADRIAKLAASDDAAAVRIAAVRALAAADGSTPVSTLKRIIARENRHAIAYFAARTLARLDEPGVAALRSLAGQRNQFTQMSAAFGLGEAGATDHLITLIDDSQRRVRREALRMLIRYPDKRALRPLLEKIDSLETAKFQAYAIRALGQIGDPAAVPTIREYMNMDIENRRQHKMIQRAGRQALRAIREGQAGG